MKKFLIITLLAFLSGGWNSLSWCAVLSSDTIKGAGTAASSTPQAPAPSATVPQHIATAPAAPAAAPATETASSTSGSNIPGTTVLNSRFSLGAQTTMSSPVVTGMGTTTGTGTTGTGTTSGTVSTVTTGFKMGQVTSNSSPSTSGSNY